VGLLRVPEPELMDELEQARAYSEADFGESHDLFVAAIASRFGALSGVVLDLGCGPADPTVRLAIANPAVTIVGVDAGPVMLELARARVTRTGLDRRIRLEHRQLPDPSLADRRFDVVVSNSLLHHLPDPMMLWRTVADCVRPGGTVAVMDLLRPEDSETVERLVAGHVADAPPVLRADFRNSLLAAYQLDEVEEQVYGAGLRALSVEPIGDHHLLVTGIL
jgi:2-polyprenyl-3-methyl-5-hydroxy-6-metoxy-1,4-benzoquinol methylase